MNYDAFSKCHPAVNFAFFLGAIGCGVVIQHPFFLIAGFLGALSYYLLLKGRKGLKMLLMLLPFFLVLTAVNPLFNTLGARVLFHVFGRPYTLEALCYGAAIAGIFVVMTMWFGCYNAVLTSDKFTSLFGNLIPSLSLLLVMVFRMVPNLLRKANQITGARKSIGKAAGESASFREKLDSGMMVLSTLVSWALEGGVVTGDAMRSRGYGTAKRSSFQMYRMTALDWTLLLLMTGLLAGVLVFSGAEATYTPVLYIAPLTPGFFCYCAFLFIPTVLHIKEAVQWHISRSGI